MHWLLIATSCHSPYDDIIAMYTTNTQINGLQITKASIDNLFLYNTLSYQ